MPLTTGFTTRQVIKGEGHIHTEKWHRCVEQVKAKGGGADPYAVCTAQLGAKGINPEHRKKHDYAGALKFDPKQMRDKFGKWVESLQSVATPGGLFVAGVDTPKPVASAADVKKQKETALQQAYEEQYKKQREETRQAHEAYEKRKAAEAAEDPSQHTPHGRSLLSDMLDVMGKEGTLDHFIKTTLTPAKGLEASAQETKDRDAMRARAAQYKAQTDAAIARDKAKAKS